VAGASSDPQGEGVVPLQHLERGMGSKRRFVRFEKKRPYGRPITETQKAFRRLRPQPGFAAATVILGYRHG